MQTFDGEVLELVVLLERSRWFGLALSRLAPRFGVLLKLCRGARTFCCSRHCDLAVQSDCDDDTGGLV